jgi:hypothetical protein
MRVMARRKRRHSITAVTRRDIFDRITTEAIAWHGRMDEVQFLSRLWDLADMPSTDYRYSDAAGDIRQHRLNNWDWEDDWVFTDERFNLMHGPDEEFLHFLCEMVHPLVRPEAGEAKAMVRSFNERLAHDGWQLVVAGEMSGRPVFKGQRRAAGKSPDTALRLPAYSRLSDPAVFDQHLRRISAGIDDDPAAAIASSKEMVESACKVVLDDYGISYSNKDDIGDLYKKVAGALKLKAESVPDSAKGSEAAQGTLRALVTVVQRMAELRNQLGLGHGRTRSSKAQRRHARLAFNAATAVAEFLLDTWHERRGD